MNGNLNVPPAMAQERALAINRQVFLEQYRMTVAKDLQQMFLAKDIQLGQPAEEWKEGGATPVAEAMEARRIAVAAATHANELMRALGFQVKEPQVQQ